MPEEINRILTDQVSQHLFIGIEEGMNNTHKEGIDEQKLFLVGNTALDALERNKELATTEILQKKGLAKKSYWLVTVHRADNTDLKENLQNIVTALNEIATEKTLVFPIHPRTVKALQNHNLSLSEKIIQMEPLGYLDFIALMNNAEVIMTDSGGVQSLSKLEKHSQQQQQKKGF